MRTYTSGPVNPANVPCNGCTLCCKGPGRVVLHPGLDDDITRYGTDIELIPDVGYALVKNKDNSCVYLVDDGDGKGHCGVWPNAPGVCRSFDCRDFARSKWQTLLDPSLRNPVMAKGRELLKDLGREP